MVPFTKAVDEGIGFVSEILAYHCKFVPVTIKSSRVSPLLKDWLISPVGIDDIKLRFVAVVV
ncbi:hypothetical protein N9J10_03625 [Flavobacteriaceae bacterium]|nr:hypothetical protein [Flavobacteriaceae bacterium]